MRTIGFCLFLLGLALEAYFFLFMTWSHSFGSPAFQLRATLVSWGGVLAILVGATLVVLGWRRARASSESVARQPDGEL